MNHSMAPDPRDLASRVNEVGGKRSRSEFTLRSCRARRQGTRAAAIALFAAWSGTAALGEAMLQYFNTSWREITEKMPELAEAGYTSLWLPPPTKGSGGLSVGYDLWDPFDLGGKDQRGSVRTRYGTEAELLRLVEVAHRFGIRIYFDNIMNHRAFDIPGYNSGTPIDLYPGLVPEDFHLRVTEDGFYRKWDNTRTWGDAWQVMNLGLADLIDLAQEPGDWNQNFGRTEGSTFKKIRFLRQPNNPEYYCYRPDGSYCGFGTTNGLTAEILAANTGFYAERVEDYLNRAARWLIDRTKADGLRLDAVKHVRADFFGATWGADKDSSDYGYLGQVQRQFNLTRGFSDANHRDTVFDTEKPRDDAMVFGEHLGEPPGYGDYINAGMRLVDNVLRNEMNNRLGNPWSGLNGFDQPGAGGFAPEHAVMHAQSHDNDYASRRELQHAFYFTRAGLGLIYTDGNHHSETLGESGGAFPRHANTAYLGQWNDGRVPNLLYIHDHFARGYQRGAGSFDGDFVAYERIDKRENGDMPDSDGATMLIMINDNYSSGLARSLSTSFASGAYLYNYSTYGGGFYKYAGELGSTVVPPGGYFVFSWRNPELPSVWEGSGVQAVTILQNGAAAGTLACTRRDGPDGDPGFNPYGLPDTNATDYAYAIAVPRVTVGTNLTILARADGSAENVLLRLDGGVDVNSQLGLGPLSGERRDRPPALSTDTFLGYEQMLFQHRAREKFAAEDVARNLIGSVGAETWQVTIGSNNWARNNGSGPWNTAEETAAWVYHAPTAGDAPGGIPQFTKTNANEPIVVWAKIGKAGQWDRAWLYYTADGTSWPEGAGGTGRETTQVIPLLWDRNVVEGADTNDWVRGTLPAQAAGAVLRYKIGVHRLVSSSIFPADATAVARKRLVETRFAITNFNAAAATVRPHADYGAVQTGLDEGFHLLRARAFLKRDSSGVGNGLRASIYNTFTQTFYYDAKRPEGEIRYPATDGETVGGQQYGAVVRSDPSVVEAWYHIEDADPNNDDTATGVANGNGRGFEPYVDGNSSGHYDSGEAFTDLNGNGVWDADIGDAWVSAYEMTPSLSIPSPYPREWRFNYANIPAGGAPATLRVRLRELSSAARATFATNDDVSGHFTTLTRTVNASGPDIRLFVAWPQQDGGTIGPGYVLKAYFSKVLAEGLSDADLISRFLIRIQSAESGRTDGGAAQSRTGYSILRDETADYHALAFAMPNLYNEQPDWLHGIEVTLERPSLPTLTATRLVKAFPTEAAPYIAIVEPAEYGSDGNPYLIIIPDVPAPTAEQRQTSVRIATATNGAAVAVRFDYAPPGFAGGLAPASTGPTIEGSSKFWDFAWTNLVPGSYRFTATVTTGTGASNTAARTATVVLRERVAASATDTDDDDDGLLDASETTAWPLPDGWDQNPKPNSETWLNDDVHLHYAYGRSDPLSPDTDGDGLPDGLEAGWRLPGSADTDTNADTNADGYRNFIGDLDPPFYNTLDNYGRVPGVNSASEGGDRSRQLAGSTTDPNNPDTDGDGLSDGIEDRNRNGWVDGDGAPIDPSYLPWLGRSWPNGRMDPGETWTETDPANPDTDGDGLSDGYGEDKDLDGTIAGDTNRNRHWDPGEVWAETDPLNADTDGDGLPDGWEARHGFDPLDNGMAGQTNLRNQVISGNVNGASGDPDADGFDNLREYVNGTDPRVADTGTPPPAGSITIGRGPAIGVLGGATNYEEFADWTTNDLIALDAYDGDGANNQGGDVYHGGDGFDSSRDLVAFYARDGGADGKFYFRVDFQDLQAYAEDGHLDLYVVIDTGNPAVGEYALPDDTDTGTEMRWEAVVAVYNGNNGRVYVDTNPTSNSTAIGEALAPHGVVARDQTAAHGFGQAYFNSELDAVEFSISRQALLDAGWNGLNAAQLNYQVFTTRDGTQNSPVGAGDIGGRSDIRDTIRDNWIASDYWRDQTYIAQHSVLQSWVGRQADHDAGKAVNVALLLHGNQHVQPGSVVQTLLNNGAGAGYHRPVAAHEVFRAPLNLHLTPTLASALQWARTDPAHPDAWRKTWVASGPEFNAHLGMLVRSNLVHLLDGTFSDHALPYFTAEFNADNLALAREFLGRIYGASFSNNAVFWTPERLADNGVLAGLAAAGVRYTVLDQETHLQRWLGRGTAYGDTGYQINRFAGVGAFAINNQSSAFLFANADGGLPMPLRQLCNRKSRAGGAGQAVVLFGAWEEFGTKANADAYDANLRWMANHPWIRVRALDEIAALAEAGQWPVVERGSAASPRTSHLWIQHATEEDFDHWYDGSAQETALAGAVFDIRAGAPVPAAYGRGAGPGILSQTWSRVAAIADTNLARLARAATHASVFESAFHNEDNNDLTRFSTGDFVWPDTSADTLAPFARCAQAQTRRAAVLRRVDQWAAVAASVNAPQSSAEDVDLDGEAEYLLYNDRLFVVFERSGGRATGTWVRDVAGGGVYQAAGPFAAYAGADTEDEGGTNVTAGGAVMAYRTSLLKDWWATRDGGTARYVNELYAFTPVAGGWRAASPDGDVTKTVTLGAHTNVLGVSYALAGGMSGQTLFVRSGFSPHLWDLLLNGQATLGAGAAAGGVWSLANTNHETEVDVSVGYADAGHNAAYNAAAVDDQPGLGVDFATVNMRNQAQTQQLELSGTGTFSFSLGFRARPSDWDADGAPNVFEDRYAAIMSSTNAADGALDADGDGVSNAGEYVAGTAPDDAGSVLRCAAPALTNGGFTVRFPAVAGRWYSILYANESLLPAAWSNATPARITVPSDRWYSWLDDGSGTTPAPGAAGLTGRFYRVNVELPQ